ncbi:MAG TPA: hydrogenase maturation protease [Candidatus Methylacidiphilales bacterium]|nr:hydrogenase maturation protease [Candidatus Methylacidiphilales bacterium]
MHKRILVIGYGNPLRGDDGIGREVVADLAERFTDPEVSILTVHQLTPELSEPIHRSDLVIFVDASSQGEPGAWTCKPVTPAMAHTPALGHHFDIANLLAYTQAVFQMCPGALVVSVAAESFTYREELSPKVRAALPAVVRHIYNQIAEFGLKQEPAHA